MAKKKVETIWSSPSRESGRELCEFKAENQKWQSSAALLFGTATHDAITATIERLETDTGKTVRRIWELMDHQFEPFETTIQEFTEKVNKNVSKWLKKFSYLLKDPSKVLMLDGEPGESVEMERLALVKIPLNKTYKNGLRGYPDLVEYFDEKTVIIWDWKTGRSKNSEIQLKAYGVLIKDLKSFKNIEIFKGAYFYIETGETVAFDFTRAELEKFQKQIVKRQNRIAKTEKKDLPRSLNTFCAWCEFKEDCPETKAVSVNLPWKLARKINSPSEYMELHNMIEVLKSGDKLLKGLMEKAKANLTEFLKENGEKIEAGDYIFERRQIPARYGYDAERVEDILRRHNQNPGFYRSYDAKRMEELAPPEVWEEIKLTARKTTVTREVISKKKISKIIEVK